MSSETTSYLITKLDRNSWRKFRGRAILNGHHSAGECLRDFVETYSKGGSYFNGERKKTT